MTILSDQNDQQPVSHAIFTLWAFLQILNFFWSLAAASGLDGAGSLSNGAFDPWWPVIFLGNYLFFRTVNYGICHLLGYHALPTIELLGGGINNSALYLPTFVRQTPSYRYQYQRRARGFQLLFETLFILLVPAVTGGLLWITNLLPGGDNQVKLFIQVLLVLGGGFYAAKAYYRLFPKLFHLNVILVEHGQPIFAHRSGGDETVQTDHATNSTFYTTDRIVTKKRH